MLVINLFGAPGSGKSTTMHQLAADMKMMGLSVEVASEGYKDILMDGTYESSLGNPINILADQNKRLEVVKRGGSDFAITDSPLPLVAYYANGRSVDRFDEHVVNVFSGYDNMNYFIIRDHEYQEAKRHQNREGALSIEEELPSFLDYFKISCLYLKSGLEVSMKILQDLSIKGIIDKQLFNDYIVLNKIRYDKINNLKLNLEV